MIRLPNPPKEYDLTWANQYTRELETTIGSLESTVAQDNSDADDAAAAAAASAAEAAASAAAAALSDTDAEASAAAAAASALAAAASATDADTSATDAATSATDAASSATDAATSATTAGTSATDAATSATQAAGSATAAAGSATQAATSAGAADADAAAASTSATQAAGSATAAGNSATAASTSAGEAVVSATNAAASAALASTSATSASTSAANAATSASAAAASATSANTSATSAATSATSASTSASSAATSATSAAGSATSAANSATSAGNSASTATTQAAAAALSATNAAASETAAAGSATSASDSSIDAANSAAAAAASAAAVAEEIAGLPVNPEQYGAVGDGVTDCLAAFEAAIAVNGSIVVPNGTFLLSAALSISMRQISIIGEGPGISTLLFAAGGLDIAVPTTPYLQFANTTISNLSILCSSAGTATAIKIGQDTAVTDNHISITNVEITGGDGVYGPTQSVTGTSHTSTLIDGIASTADILVNSSVTSGPGLAGGLTYVASKTATSVTLNQATTTSTTDTFTFNAGELEYWLIGIELNGVRQAVLSNIRINGGGAGKTEQGIYMITGDTDAQFDFSLDYCVVSQCTTSLQVEGWFEGLYVDNCNFYTCRDAFIAEHATSTIVGTFAFTNSAFFCSRSPFITDRIAGIQLTNCFIARGFAEAAWNPPAGGVIAGVDGFSYAGSLIDITGSGGATNYDLHTITNNNLFSSGTSTNAILMTDVEGATIVSNTIWGGSFTNGLNFQGSSDQITFDRIVAAFTTITNPVVLGGSTGLIVTGTFILNSNYVTDFQQKTFQSEAAPGTPNIAMTGDINEAKWLTSLGGYNLTFYNDKASQPDIDGSSTISYDGRTYYARAQLQSDGGFRAANDIVSENNIVGLGVYAQPSSGDARISAAAASGSDYARHEAHIPSTVAWYWGSDSSADWKLAANSTTFASPAITVDSSTNQVDLSGPLNVVNYIKTGAIPVASLPAASVGSGSRWMVSDATATTFASVVAGGGSNHVPVFSDGTNWRIG